MGLSSLSTEIFSNDHGNLILQYLDDFFGGHSNKDIAKKQLNFLLKKFQQLNLPTSPEKCTGPSKTITILGWLISSVGVLTICLTQKKRLQYLSAVNIALNKKKINLFYLQKLIGYLRYAVNVAPIGKYFFRSLDQQCTQLNADVELGIITKYTYVPLLQESLYNLQIWKSILINLNDNPIPIRNLVANSNLPRVDIWTDATTTVGIGGLDTLGNWYQYHYSDLLPFSGPYSRYQIKHWKNIQYLELLSIVLMLIKFGEQYRNHEIIIYNDNPTAVKATKKGTVLLKNKIFYPLVNLVKLIAIKAVQYHIKITCINIHGDLNGPADALSRYFKRPFNFYAINYIPGAITPNPRVPIHNLINKVMNINN